VLATSTAGWWLTGSVSGLDGEAAEETLISVRRAGEDRLVTAHCDRSALFEIDVSTLFAGSPPAELLVSAEHPANRDGNAIVPVPMEAVDKGLSAHVEIDARIALAPFARVKGQVTIAGSPAANSFAVLVERTAQGDGKIHGKPTTPPDGSGRFEFRVEKDMDVVFRAGSDGFVAIFVLLGATLCYGVCTVAIKRWLHDVPAVFLAMGQIGFAAAYLVPLSLALGQFPGPEMGGNAMLSLLLLGAINSGVAVIGYMWLISTVGAVRASVVTYILPPIGVTLGWLALDEPIGWNLVVSLVCVIAGVALVQQLSVRALWNRGPFGTTRPVAAAAAD
jgi:hypothetical protein